MENPVDVIKVQSIKGTLYISVPAELAKRLRLKKGERLLVYAPGEGILYRRREERTK
jgi:bifunctional DNA-binding transcriptional regulator/antitoxin component of YhaV-PrlF toxin-antitoxin module